MKSVVTSEDRIKHSDGQRKFQFLDLEVDDELVECRSSLMTLDDITLHRMPNIPTYLHDNPYIIHGYRVSLSFKHCLQSAFSWNNETINIWSHLLGCMVLFLVMLYDNIIVIPSFGGSILDHAITSISLICNQICLLCSTGYHMFYCHSERASRRWLLVDLTGISIGVLGVYLPGVHYAFYCLSIWRDLYFIIIAILSAAVLMVQLQPQRRSSIYFRYKAWVYAGLVAYGIVPTVHWVILSGGFNNSIVQMFVPKVMTMYLIGLISFFFYLSKIPERFFPGQFDYIGSSHQLWHIGLVIAFVWWYQAGQEIIKFRLSHGCSV